MIDKSTSAAVLAATFGAAALAGQSHDGLRAGGARSTLTSLDPGISATEFVELQSRAPQMSRIDADTGELRLGRWQDPDEEGRTDYSPQAFFQREHGEFMRQAFPFRPDMRLGYRYVGETDIDDEVGNFSIDEFEFDGLYRYAIDPDVFLYGGGTFRSLVYDFSPNSGISDEGLFEASGTIGAGVFTSNNTLVQVEFSPGIYSDLDGELNDGDWQFFGRGLVTTKLSDTFYAHFGIEVEQTFDDVPIYPLIGFAAILDEEWRLDVLAPRHAKVSWSPSPEWIFTGGFELEGSEFNYRAPGVAANSFGPGVPAIAVPSGQQLDIDIQEFRIFVESTYRFSDQFSLSGRFGSILSGNYDYAGPNLPPPNSFNSDYDGATNPNIEFELWLGWTF